MIKNLKALNAKAHAAFFVCTSYRCAALTFSFDLELEREHGPNDHILYHPIFFLMLWQSTCLEKFYNWWVKTHNSISRIQICYGTSRLFVQGLSDMYSSTKQACKQKPVLLFIVFIVHMCEMFSGYLDTFLLDL